MKTFLRTLIGVSLCQTVLAMAASPEAHTCDIAQSDASTRLCLQDELRDSDRTINGLYASLLAASDEAGKARLRERQRKWLHDRNALCQLDDRAANRQRWIQDMTGDAAKMTCVITQTRLRISELQAPQGESLASQAIGAAPQKDPYVTAYDNHRVTVHTNGKWYFEVTVNRDAVAQIFPTDIMVGVSDKEHFSGTAENVSQGTESPGLVRLGIAVDLDNGKLYTSRNGDWGVDVPGSNRGTDIKLGRAYYSAILVSAKSHNQQYFDGGAITPNFGGDKPMVYAMPPGYLGWRDAAPN